MTYVQQSRLDKILHLPIALAQTELRAGKNLQICQLPLAAGQTMEVRVLNLHLLRLLTPGVLPALNNTSLGLLSVGIYGPGTMLTGAPALVSIGSPGVATLNPFCICSYTTPGTYTAVVSNNSNNIDLSIVVTGSAKVFS